MWPDILAQSFDYTENYGRHGCDNFFIYYNALSFLLKTELTSDDTVVVQWTEPARLDYIDNVEWKGLGAGSTEILIKNKLDCFISHNTIHFKSLFYMYSIMELLKKSSCKWIFLFLSDHCLSYDEKFNLENPFTNELSNFYKSKILEFKENIISNPSLADFSNPLTNPIVIKNGNTSYTDGHPTPRVSFMYLQEHVFNKLDNLNIPLMKKYSNLSENILRKKIVNKILDLSHTHDKFITYKKIITFY
jgi:hypothetical protein